jgi:hypothetical protein
VLVVVNSTRNEMMSDAKIETAKPRICQFLTSSESNICNCSVTESNVTLLDDESLWRTASIPTRWQYFRLAMGMTFRMFVIIKDMSFVVVDEVVEDATFSLDNSCILLR